MIEQAGAQTPHQAVNGTVTWASAWSRQPPAVVERSKTTEKSVERRLDGVIKHGNTVFQVSLVDTQRR